MIGATDLRGGLYILNQPQVTTPNTPPSPTDAFFNSFFLKHNNCNFVNQYPSTHDNHCNIWHLRLGHPLHDKLIEM